VYKALAWLCLQGGILKMAKKWLSKCPFCGKSKWNGICGNQEHQHRGKPKFHPIDVEDE
jgi:hypothetical protein